MTARDVRNEFAKLRHLRVAALAALLVLGVVALSVAGAAGTGSLSPPAVLAALSRALPIVSPLLIAAIASRAMETEHASTGWLANQCARTDRGALCRAKFVATAIVVAAATAVAALGGGLIAGLGTPDPGAEIDAGVWAGYTLAVVVVNLAVLALQLALSARFDNQLVPLGVGIVGTVIAAVASGLPGWLAHLTPWGYYALIAAAGYEAGEIVTRPPGYLSVLALAALASTMFAALTHRLDRQEA